MTPMLLSEIALWTRGSVNGTDVHVHGVSIDSRTLQAGELFVALPGERGDGHDFVAAAAERGASGALVSRLVDVDLAQVLVADSLLALGDLASAARAALNARVIGITGSNGKTTVKNMIAAILARCGKTHASSGNFNNEIGLPLSLLATPADSDYVVLEMGAGKPGDIAYLGAIARPDIGLVTNVAPAHLERMGSLEGVAETKGALYEALPANGMAVINADDVFAEYFSRRADPRTLLRFGLQHDASISARDLNMEPTGTRFSLLVDGAEAEVHLHLPWRHNVLNALAAAAVGVACAVPLADIAAGLSAVEPIPGRLHTRVMPAGWTLIDDSYNANPGSLTAALATLAIAEGARWLVLGDMAELGPEAAIRHAEMGAMAREQGVTRLWAVGPLSAHAAAAFGADAAHFDSREALVEALRMQLRAGVTCLVKGSRSAAMDKVVAALIQPGNGGQHHAA